MIYWLICPAAECPGIDGGTSPPDFLGVSERETYVKLTFPKRRREWLLGRWTAKRLLRLSQEGYRDLPLSAIIVGNDPDGAPYLSVDREGRLPMSLSISHREERAFCALSPSATSSIGADMERVEPRALAFVHDFFTSQEAERVWNCSPSTRDTLVTVIWSAKEAVLKALRQGLRVDTRRVEVRYVAGIERPEPAHNSASVFPIRHALRPGLQKVVKWHEVRVHCTLSGAGRFVAWWRPDGDDVLTLAF